MSGAGELIEVPVLVVGGGPVGLMGGVQAARQGLSSLIVERRAGPQPAPAAHVINSRSFEICRASGVDMEAVRSAAQDPRDAGYAVWMTRFCGEEVGRLPFERQGDECLRFTPTPLRNLSQHHFEPILVETVRKTQGAAIRYSHEWLGAEQDAAGVTSRVRDVESDAVHEVRSRYVIGADGAGSRVRKALGIEMDGPPRIRAFLMIHIEANLRQLAGDRPGVLYWMMDPACPGIFVSHGLDREWVYMHGFGSDQESVDDYPEERCRAIVECALGTDTVPFEVVHRGAWTMSAQVAQSFRDRRIFLVGDAAHRFPPTGGLGLNSGLQDVHGLAWKLGAVEEGWAHEDLLSTYETERQPVARNNADQSLRNALKLIEVPQALGVLEDPTTERMDAALTDPATRRGVEQAIANQAEHFDMLGLQIGYAYEEGALCPDGSPPLALENPTRDFQPSTRPGARLAHAWLESGGERISSLDLVAPRGFTLLTGPDGAAWCEAAASLLAPLESVCIGDAAIRDAEGHWAEVADIDAEGALLVRPDQHIAWRARGASEDPARDLELALKELLGARPS